MAIKFYKCEVCGNIVCKIEDSGTSLSCCGRQMHELRSASTDGALEKHVPVHEYMGDVICVKIGEEPHPMEKSHYIDFVVLETTQGFSLKKIRDSENPITYFRINPEENVVNIYIYCNLHGLYSLY